MSQTLECAPEGKLSAAEKKKQNFEEAKKHAGDNATYKDGEVNVTDKGFTDYVVGLGLDPATGKAWRNATSTYIGAAHQAAGEIAIDAMAKDHAVEKVDLHIDLDFMGKADGRVHRAKEVHVPPRNGETERTTKLVHGFNRLNYELLSGSAASPFNQACSALKEKAKSIFDN